jgi:hypothetical protein
MIKPIHFTIDKIFNELAIGSSLAVFYGSQPKQRSLCGWDIISENTTSDNRLVTCGRCKQLLKREDVLTDINVKISKFVVLCGKSKKNAP